MVYMVSCQILIKSSKSWDANGKLMQLELHLWHLRARQRILSKQLTYPTFEKGNLSSKVPLVGGYVSFQMFSGGYTSMIHLLLFICSAVQSVPWISEFASMRHLQSVWCVWEQDSMGFSLPTTTLLMSYISLPKVLLSRWFSFFQGGICHRSLEGNHQFLGEGIC